MTHDRLGDRELKSWLLDVGIDWEQYPDFFKRGTYVQRRKTKHPFTTDEIAALPEKHNARKNPNLVVERTEIVTLSNLPLLEAMDSRGDFICEPTWESDV